MSHIRHKIKAEKINMKMKMLMITLQLTFILLFYIIAGPSIFFSQIHLHCPCKTANWNVYNLRCNSKISRSKSRKIAR